MKAYGKSNEILGNPRKSYEILGNPWNSPPVREGAMGGKGAAAAPAACLPAPGPPGPYRGPPREGRRGALSAPCPGGTS